MLLLGAATLWGSSRLRWVDGGALGAERAPALVPLALLVLAGIAGLFATGGWPRRVLAGVLCIAGTGACAVAVVALLGAEKPQVGPVVAVLGGALVVVAGALAIRSARRLPRMGTRYAGGQAKRRATDPDSDLWNALSDGEDPTATH